MAKTARRLVGPAYLGTTPATLYTAPALTSAVIRHIHFRVRRVSTSVAIRLSIGTDAENTRVVDYELPAGGHDAQFVHWILEPGHKLEGWASVGSAVVIMVNGEEVVA